ncbi:MAG: hypothetical protein M1822_009675 [Bathelium mastoideum]|nr:MAG: hypothetical protein M1822_009675 [Bathelium mastoideum]
MDKVTHHGTYSTSEANHETVGANNQALIDNPLRYLNPAQVDSKARTFVKDFGLANEADLFVKSGRILRDPQAWRSVPDLTEEEKEALRDESTAGFWGQPKELRLIITTLCVAAVVQGWNQTASNGANLEWPEAFGLDVRGCDPQGHDAWIFAIVNAATYLSASLIGCWLSDPLNEYFYGRRAAICCSAMLILASVVGGACTRTWRELLICRILLGMGMGCKASVVPVFAAEVAPAHIRGSLVMNWQLFDALGIFLGFTANLIVSQTGGAAWRWQTGSSVLPTVVLLSLILICPESPRFLMTQGRHRYRDAYKTLKVLRGHSLLAAKELFYVHCQMQEESRQISGTASVVELRPIGSEATASRENSVRSIPYWQKFGELFTKKRIRNATLTAVVVMIGQQLCGVNVLAFYSSSFFCDASESAQRGNQDQRYLTPLFLSWGIGLSNFIFSFPAYFLIDRKGRQWLLIVTLPCLALAMLATSLSFLIPTSNSAHTPAICLFTFIFMSLYSWGMGPVPFTLSAEVFPIEHRVVGMSFAVFCNLFGAGLLTLFVPSLTNAIGHAGLLGVFAGLNALAFVLVFLFVRETAGAAVGGTPGSMTFLSLEELNYIFRTQIKDHVRYKVSEVLPWAWHYYVLRDRSRGDQPDKLYIWASTGS